MKLLMKVKALLCHLMSPHLTANKELPTSPSSSQLTPASTCKTQRHHMDRRQSWGTRALRPVSKSTSPINEV